MAASTLATQIHPTALVDPGACLAAGVSVGPFAVIGPQVRIGAGSRIGPHVVIDGQVTIGSDNPKTSNMPATTLKLLSAMAIAFVNT